MMKLLNNLDSWTMTTNFWINLKFLQWLFIKRTNKYWIFLVSRVNLKRKSNDHLQLDSGHWRGPEFKHHRSNEVKETCWIWLPNCSFVSTHWPMLEYLDHKNWDDYKFFMVKMKSVNNWRAMGITANTFLLLKSIMQILSCSDFMIQWIPC